MNEILLISSLILVLAVSDVSFVVHRACLRIFSFLHTNICGVCKYSLDTADFLICINDENGKVAVFGRPEITSQFGSAFPTSY
jgi:hypothetical protein